MALPVLQTASYLSVVSAADYFDKMRNFLVSTLGWTENLYYNANRQWDTTNPYTGWEAGTHSWLDITSAGHGSQQLRFCMYLTPLTGDATTSNLYVGASRNASTYATNTPTNPIGQSAFCWSSAGTANNNISLPQGAIYAAYFFGNAYCFYSVIQTSSGSNIVWGFGSPTLLNTARTDAQHLYMPHISANFSADYKWNSANQAALYYSRCGLDFPAYVSFGQPANCFYAYIEGAGRTQTTSPDYYLLNTCIPMTSGVSYTSVPGAYFDVMNSAVQLNTYNTIRPIIQPKVYYKDSITAKWECVGTQPWGNIWFAGLNIGEVLVYGAEQYVAFPNRIGADTYGKVFRVV
jgi:hypothetical protein